jgi:hypothetical protein
MMLIQRVIVMSDQTLVQSGHAAGPPNEAEYNAVYAAVTATERGRWFLTEFAKRNRGADTDLIMAAIARIETAVAGGAAPQAALPRDPEVVAATAAAVEASRASGGERDEVGARNTSAPQDVPDARSRSDRDYSDAVAAIAASLTTRLGESAQESDRESDAQVMQEVTQKVAQEPDRAAAAPEDGLAAAEIAQPALAPLRARVPQDNAQRWHIEGPDFVFGAGDQDIKLGSAEPQSKSLQSESLQSKSPQMHAQLLGAELLRAEQWVEEAPQPVVVAPDPQPALSAAEAPPPAAAVLDIAPLTEISRPQLRIASEAMPVNQRGPRYGSLTVTDALSEDEVIALFG